MTLYGYARVSVREPEDKNLDLQVERLVRAGCAMGNIRAEEASGAKDDRGGLLELLDLVVEGDTLVVTHIDRLSRGLTYGLQVIEGLHRVGAEFRSLAEDFDTSTSTGKLQLSMVLAFSEWWRNSIRERSVAGQAVGQNLYHQPGGLFPLIAVQPRACDQQTVVDRTVWFRPTWGSISWAGGFLKNTIHPYDQLSYHVATEVAGAEAVDDGVAVFHHVSQIFILGPRDDPQENRFVQNVAGHGDVRVNPWLLRN